jgi:protein-S-isoprenylcysteine O-methyltransferase Ste14
MKIEIIIGILWIVYGTLHSVLASNEVKNKINFPYYRLVYTILSLVLMIPILYFQLTTPSQLLMPASTANNIFGGLMISLGVYMLFISFKQYDLKAFLGIQAEAPAQLITDGIMSVVRHPLYLSTLVIVWGVFGITGTANNLAMALALTAYIRIGIYFEEKSWFRFLVKLMKNTKRKFLC